MNTTITTSVGRGGRNCNPLDIKLVQRLLNNHRPPPLRMIDVDGVVGQQTIDAISYFQSTVMGIPLPDGRVDVGGRTIRALSGGSASPPPPENVALPPPTNETGSFSSQEQVDAIKKAFGHVYQQGENMGKCARWTYNLAYCFVRSLRGQSLPSGDLLPAGGNANGAGYHNNLAQLGYTKSVITLDASKATVKNLISQTQYNLGDVLVYWALEDDAGVKSNGDASDGHWKYGHTQIFTGQKCLPAYSWACDQKDNFKCSFVYNNATKYPGDRWALFLFRAPAA